MENNTNGPVTRKDLSEAVDKITELVRDVETHMLTEFHRYANWSAVSSPEPVDPIPDV